MSGTGESFCAKRYHLRLVFPREELAFVWPARTYNHVASHTAFFGALQRYFQHVEFHDRSYKAIFLPDVESLHPVTAELLKTFVESGGTILCIGKAPSRACGYIGNALESRTVNEEIQSLRNSYPLRAPILTLNEDDMVNWYREVQKKYALEPDVLINEPTDYVSQLHYVSGNRDIFFFTNYGPQQTHTFRADFHFKDKTPWLWDAESGERAPYPVFGSKNVLNITLGPSESRLIVFEKSATSGKSSSDRASKILPALIDKPLTERTITGPWNLKLIHVNGTTQSRVLETLSDLSQQNALKSFAGTMTYSNHFQVDHPDGHFVLDLGHLHSVSELVINGRLIGTRWYGEHTYDLSRALIPGVNEVTIKVVSTLGDYMKTLTDNKTAEAWTGNTPFYPLGLTQPVRLVRLR